MSKSKSKTETKIEPIAKHEEPIVVETIVKKKSATVGNPDIHKLRHTGKSRARDAAVDLVEPIHERQPGENNYQWELFCMYRDLGYSRSLAKLSLNLKLKKNLYADNIDLGIAVAEKELKSYKGDASYNYLSKLSIMYSWPKRIASYLDDIEKMKKIALQKNIDEMVTRHSEMSKVGSQAMFIPVNEIGNRYAAYQKQVAKINGMNISQSEKHEKLEALTDKLFNKMNFVELLKFAAETAPKFKIFTDIERTSRGEPVEIIKNDGETTSNNSAVVVNLNVKNSKSTLNANEAE